MPEISAPDQKLGLTIPVGAGHLSELGQALDVAAGAGYTDVWSSEVSGSDAFTPLVLAAMLRPELRLGSAIIPAYTRGAATLAMSVASLADTAKGEVLVGIGSSSNIIVEKWNGIPFANPYYQTRDMVRFLKEALTGEKVNFEGRTFKIDGFRLGLVPERKPKILVAALRSGMLSMAGREADGAILNYLTADDVAKVVPYVFDHNPDAEIVARIFVIPTTDIEAGRAIARRQIAAYLNVPVYAAFHDWLGRAGELDQMWSLWSQGDRPHALEAVPEHLIGEMFLTGDPATIAEGVKRYVDAGVTTPMLAVISLERDPQATLDAVAQLGTAIRSALGARRQAGRAQPRARPTGRPSRPGRTESVTEGDGETLSPDQAGPVVLEPNGVTDDLISQTDRNWERSGWEGGPNLRAALSVLRVETVIRHEGAALLRPFQLSMPRHELLGDLYFSQRGEITLGKLSDLLMTHPTSVTSTVDGLERLHLVERVAHPTDRRMTLVRITDEGRRRFEDATSVMAATKFSIDTLTAEEAETVYRLLRKVLLTAAESRSGSSVPRSVYS